ncbi:MAG: prepilin-type N-terminal cleavage/methylation domain-containing protein [Phycisphaerales bacterium]|nr:MAG: prepilin-type N-terminal cleavage/methylation domain-containing protein [Phycisphaerales bacterium]
MPTGLRRSRQTIRTTEHGFTLIELLVVVSIISLLIGILLPSLSQALRIARSTICSTTQRQLMQGMITYAMENDDAIPGIGTSGYGIMERARGVTGDCASALQFANRRITPVQNFDWITPSVNPDDLPIERAARFEFILNNFACPSNTTRVIVWPGGDCGRQDMEEYIETRAEDLPIGPSYLMNANWGMAGPRPGDLGWPVIRQSAYSFTSPVRMPESYRPRINAVGNPSRKAAFGDGFRYLTADGVVDIDASIAPQFWGAFSDSSPVFMQSRSYGTAQTNDNTQGRNLPLSYRHNMTMNAAFFDGHVANLTMDQSRDPSLWFPAGSRLTPSNNNQIHPSVLEKYQPGDYFE